jgi:hypothetical protein
MLKHSCVHHSWLLSTTVLRVCVGALQSRSRQAEYAVEQQRGASELQAAHAEGSRLADALTQAEHAKQAVDAQLKDMHSQHRKVRLHLCATTHKGFRTLN